MGILIGNCFGGIVENCYSMGVATGWTVGGLIGKNNARIAACYSASDISGQNFVGGLVGSNKGTITNSYSTGQIEGWEHIGGLAGHNFTGTIKNSYSTVNVSGKLWTGGLTGGNYKGTITNCCSKGNVHGGSYTGGLVGWNREDSTITNCYSTGEVYGHSNVGGLVGSNAIESMEMDEHISGKITNCYSTSNAVGALVGDNSKGEISSSFWDIETSGQAESAGGIGKTTAEMQTASTFLEAGWDFVDETENGTEDIWWIAEGQDYPKLFWELTDNNQ